MKLCTCFATLLILATACGSSSDDNAGPTPAEPTAPSIEEQLYGGGDGVVIDEAGAKLLPVETAGAITVRDLPKLIARIGLGADARAILRALGEELITVLGFDLLDAGAARQAGVDTSAPVSFAWLDDDADQIALVVSISDTEKFQEALGERPAIIAHDRALIPLGRSAKRTRDSLTGVAADRSLASSGKLEAFDTVDYGADAALFIDGTSYVLGAKSIAVGLTLRPDSVRAKAVARFGANPPKPAEWGDRAARRMGAPHGEGEAPFAHQLLRELEQGTKDPRTVFAVRDVLDHIGAGSLRRALSKKLGYVAMAGRRGGNDLVYYGGVAFNGALAEELGPALAELGTRALSRRPDRRRGALEAARNAGILGTLSQGGAIATITGTSDPDLLANSLDNSFGSGGVFGDIDGAGGFGAGGFGAVGGGTGSGRIGSGNYGTIGYGSGKRTRVRIGKATATGNLDKNIIRRYIRRRLRRVKHCYEKLLVAEPKLAGNVVVQFTIGTRGRVMAATASGVNDDLAACVRKQIEGITFPRPKSGTVQVRYPFTFKPS